MKITINGNEIRIHGERGVDFLVYAFSDKDKDRFSSSLVFSGMEHGCLPSVEVSGDQRIVIINNLEKGTQLYK